MLISYASSLGVMSWKKGEQNVDYLVTKPQIYEETISTPLWAHVSSVESLTEDLQKLKEEIKEKMSQTPPCAITKCCLWVDAKPSLF